MAVASRSACQYMWASENTHTMLSEVGEPRSLKMTLSIPCTVYDFWDNRDRCPCPRRGHWSFPLYNKRMRCGNNRNDDGVNERRQYLIRGEDTASSTLPQPASPSSPNFPSKATVSCNRSRVNGPTIQAHLSIPHCASGNASRPDTCRSPFVADAPSSPTADWSSKRCAELTQKLEVLQHT